MSETDSIHLFQRRNTREIVVVPADERARKKIKTTEKEKQPDPELRLRQAMEHVLKRFRRVV